MVFDPGLRLNEELARWEQRKKTFMSPWLWMVLIVLIVLEGVKLPEGHAIVIVSITGGAALILLLLILVSWVQTRRIDGRIRRL